MSKRIVASSSVIIAALALGTAAVAADFPNPLPEEALGSTATLPQKYPSSWVFLHDLHFASLIDGRAAIVDVAAENRNLKGQIPVAQFGSVTPSTTRPEIYVGETFYSRLTRGERTDAITIYDKATLAPKGEIILPGGKRGLFVTIKNSLQLTNGEKWLLVFNFTPAASVSVIDLDSRTIISEIETPGCSQIYPTGARSFATLCAEGTITSVQLDQNGKATKTVTSKPFNDIDNDPIFMMPAMVGKVAWFVTFKGNFRGIDLSGDVAKVLPAFSIAKQAGGNPEWRPGGWQVIGADPAGLLYVLMNQAGREGSHKDGGTEAWVVDPRKKALTKRIPLKNHTLSVELTNDGNPLLVVARVDGQLDVYSAPNGDFLRSIGGVASNPMAMTAAR
jgi:methylamine dehydrogenase heavy chain